MKYMTFFEKLKTLSIQSYQYQHDIVKEIKMIEQLDNQLDQEIFSSGYRKATISK